MTGARPTTGAVGHRPARGRKDRTLEDLFVDRASRGAGVAGRLFEALYETAREHGATRVYWLGQEYNGAARSLYDTVGRLTSFVVYERDL
jgi:GNAT superfamily N-acetyltransferase